MTSLQSLITWPSELTLCSNVHLIDEWGNDKFRPLFHDIGSFFCYRLHEHVALVALLATLKPRKQVTSICKSLGLFGDTFHIVQLSNERKNTHMIVQPLEDSLSGNSFPQLLEYIQPGWKL